MGTVVKRGNKWRAVIRKKGHQVRSKTFSRQVLAKKWIGETELAMEKSELVGQHQSIGKLVQKYLTEVAPLKPIAKDSMKAFRYLRRMTDKLHLDHLNATDLLAWHKEYCPKASPPSLKRYLNRIVTVLKTAEALWGVTVPWTGFRKAREAMSRLGAIAECRDRTRRVEGDEVSRIKACVSTAIPLLDILDLAVLTALRSAEITRLRWSDLDEHKRTIWVRDRKHPTAKVGNDWEIPLLGEAFSIVKRQPRVGELVFPYKSSSVEAAYRRARKRAGVTGLRFHDLRREGISLLFTEGYSIPEVAMVSGHRSWNNLRRYTKLSPEGMHDGPLSKRK